MSEPSALKAERPPQPDRGAGRRFLVGYGIILTLAGLILADEPEHSAPWRGLGVAAAVIGLSCVLAPLTHRRPPDQRTAQPAPPRAPSAAAKPPQPPVPDPAAAQSEFDRRRAELNRTQMQLDRLAADLVDEQRRLEERVVALRAEQARLDAQFADLGAPHNGRPSSSN